MRAQKVDPENVDQQLFETFRTYGYDGASMEVLSQATGLKKASLYHRFPNGKKEMALHALQLVEQSIQDDVVAVAADKKLKPAARIKKIVAAINELYNGGANNCLFRTLSVGPDAEAFKAPIGECFRLLNQGLSAIAVELGATNHAAQQKARHINVLIQGSLVMAGITGDKSYFKDALGKIPALLGGK